MSEYRVAHVGDMHAGSVFGLLSKDFTTRAGHRIEQNAGQAYLHRCWVDMCQRYREVSPDILVVMGDEVDGRQPMQKATELCLPLLSDQRDVAQQYLEMLISACPTRPEIYVIQGTEYHDGKAADDVESLAQVIGAEEYFGLGTGRYSREVLDLEINGVILNFAHHLGGMSGLYRATSPDREALWSALAGKEGKAPKADCLVRGHLHHFVHVEYPTKHILINPCFQLQTRFMRKRSVYRMIPDLGSTWLKIDPKAKERREDPIIVRKLFYDLPPYVTVKAKLLARAEKEEGDGEAPATG
ncbi:hypothetical protein LCGC14_1827390 [marine sediment metagenome]|uniref:Calcineurin-like phosphoesterase domain-containing protein n=1 Tax=marine sediment metagenome TaxID=412755 RepID=A0A0F9GH17_9ZZZZ